MYDIQLHNYISHKLSNLVSLYMLEAEFLAHSYLQNEILFVVYT
jgi:hypothetical protein